jgi:hypothetical protein
MSSFTNGHLKVENLKRIEIDSKYIDESDTISNLFYNNSLLYRGSSKKSNYELKRNNPSFKYALLLAVEIKWIKRKCLSLYQLVCIFAKARYNYQKYLSFKNITEIKNY